MSTLEHAQFYLITPPSFDLAGFSDQLARVLDAHDVACVRLAQTTTDEQILGKSADTLREVCHAREVAVVIDTHHSFIETHGLDGVHLPDGSRQLRDLRKQFGEDAILGSYCGTTKHTGMTAGEMGADYVSFGPIGQSALGDGQTVAFETFEWWSQMVEVPVVAEGLITLDDAEKLAQVVDFFALGDELWSTDDPAKTLQNYLSRIS